MPEPAQSESPPPTRGWGGRDDPAGRLSSLWRQGQQPNVADFLAAAGTRDPEEILAVLRVDQSERFRLGQWVRVETYLDAVPAFRDHREQALDLIFAEYLLREEMGQRPALEEYLLRFPQYAQELKLQLELHQALGTQSQSPSSRTQGIATQLDRWPVESGVESEGLLEITGYTVLGVLGRGGMGVVYRAWQQDLNRSVAIKMVHGGAQASPAILARFRVEAEAVARLKHPNLVQIHGIGQQAGSPYLVLELVEGDSLAQRLAGTPQPVAMAAGLVETLARAIHAAHQQGVVHRDLTPANVLLTAEGIPKITDFGLAKLLIGGGDLRTHTGELLGTPSYMAPEQAASRHHAISAATDVYALGAILYELLTGRPPFKAESPLETSRQVLTDEPLAPSRLRPKLPRNLETICLKCLGKEPAQRYASALELAEDLRRFQEGRSIVARPVGSAERLRKWVKRQPAVAALLAVSGVALVAGVVGLGAVAGIQARANSALRKANEATNQALAETTKAQAETRAALAQSEESRQQAEGVSEFLVEAFRSPDPAQTGREVKVADVLDRASAKLDKGFAGSQATKGALLDALGRTYRGLGLYDRAVSLHTKARAVRETALGPDHPDTLASRHNLATAYQEAGRMSEAIALHEGTLKLRESKLGPDHDHTLKSRNNLANAYWSAGRNEDAIALHEGTLKLRESKLGPDHPDTLNSRHNLALTYWSAGRYEEAVALHESTLKLRESKLGPDHPDTLNSRHNLAVAYRSAGRIAEAIALDEATLKLREAKLGPDHPDTLTSRNGLAYAYARAGRLPEAIVFHEANLQLLESRLGPDHPVTLHGRTNLANDYQAAGRTAEATALHQRTLELREAKLGPDHPETLASRTNLAIAYAVAGRLSEAIAAVRGDAQADGGQAGRRPPLYARQPHQPRRGLRVARPLGRGRASAARRAGPPPQERPARQPPPGRRPRRARPEPADAVAVVRGRAHLARGPGDPRESGAR